MNLHYGGYVYIQKKRHNRTMNWLCCKGSNTIKSRCMARVSTEGVNKIRFGTHRHNHPATELMTAQKMFYPVSKNDWFRRKLERIAIFCVSGKIDLSRCRFISAISLPYVKDDHFYRNWTVVKRLLLFRFGSFMEITEYTLNGIFLYLISGSQQSLLYADQWLQKWTCFDTATQPSEGNHCIL